LGRVEAAARGLALEQFEEVAGTEGFMRMGGGAVGILLDDDLLCVSSEEAALEALVSCMKWGVGSAGSLRGWGLLSKIRFCLFGANSLAVDVHQLFSAEYANWIDGHVLEALRVKAAGEGRGELIGRKFLGEKAHIVRARCGVRWERCGAGGERRLQGHTARVYALAECQGLMCSGSSDGSIRVWGGANLEHQRTLRDEEDPWTSVLSLAAWEGHLISGHESSMIRVWNVATGVCDQVLQGHSDWVRCLSVSGTRLVSGSDDYSVKVWAMGAGAAWPCERTLVGHDGWVCALATWKDKVLSGSEDASVRVWDMGTGAHDVTLTGHEDTVNGLAVHGNRLYSASSDGTIREWVVGTWAALRMVEAHDPEERQVSYCLAVSGSKLISGSMYRGDADAAQQNEVRVWDLGTLECEHTLPQPSGSVVCCLAAGRGQVWGGVGNEVVVWGRA
jgi:WD40 repeat protein